MSLDGGSGGDKENVAPSTSSLAELNPAFALHALPLEAQFEQIEEEFGVLERTTMDPRTYSFKYSLMSNNKNRYFNVLANDQTIFPSPPLTAAAAGSSPLYINGNLVDLAVSPTFVACQAPTPMCIPDFLTTLCTHNISLVLMLTSTVENNMLKADRYWPDDDGASGVVEVFGTVRVWKDPKDPYTYDEQRRLLTRPFFIKHDGATAPHKLVHVQYIDWPDHGVPKSTEPFEALLQSIAAYREVGSADALPPVLVHCSAGIGRTGTLIGAYAALQRLQRGQVGANFMRELVGEMRAARFGMVQRVEQYMFMYQIVLRSMGVDVAAFAALLQRKADAFQMRIMMSRQSPK